MRSCIATEKDRDWCNVSALKREWVGDNYLHERTKIGSFVVFRPTIRQNRPKCLNELFSESLDCTVTSGTRRQCELMLGLWEPFQMRREDVIVAKMSRTIGHYSFGHSESSTPIDIRILGVDGWGGRKLKGPVVVLMVIPEHEHVQLYSMTRPQIDLFEL